MPNNVNPHLIHPNRQRIKFVERPLVGLVELTRRSQDTEFSEPASKRTRKPEIRAGTMEPRQRRRIHGQSV